MTPIGDLDAVGATAHKGHGAVMPTLLGCGLDVRAASNLHH
jgi:hypothetical protein